MFKWLVNKMNNNKGFTLVELVVVIAILGILSAIAIPKFFGTTAKANRTAVEANLRVIESAATLYEAENGDVPESLAELKAKGFIQSEPEGPDGVIYEWNKNEKKAEATKGNDTGTWWTVDNTVSLPIDWSTSSGSGTSDGGEN